MKSHELIKDTMSNREKSEMLLKDMVEVYVSGYDDDKPKYEVKKLYKSDKHHGNGRWTITPAFLNRAKTCGCMMFIIFMDGEEVLGVLDFTDANPKNVKYRLPDKPGLHFYFLEGPGVPR